MVLHVLKQAPHGGTVILVKPPRRVVIGVLPSGQPQEGDLVPADRLQLAAIPYSGHKPVEPDAE